MKSISKYFNFLFVILLFTFAGSVNAGQNKANGKWQIVKKQFGSENIEVSFPNKPNENNSEGYIFLSTTKDKNGYMFMGPTDPIAGLDKDFLYYILMDGIKDEPIEVISSQLFEQDDHWVIELIVFSSEDGLVSENQLHVTDNNFYVMEVSYTKGKRNSDTDKFFNSIKIL